MEKCSIENPITDLNEAIIQLRNEYQSYKEIKKHASLKRRNYLEEVAAAKSNQNNKKTATIVKTLLLHEQQREIGRRLQHIIGKFRSGVTCVEAPNQEGEWVQVTGKVPIEQACQEENVRRFTQANNTPSLI